MPPPTNLNKARERALFNSTPAKLQAIQCRKFRWEWNHVKNDKYKKKVTPRLQSLYESEVTKLALKFAWQWQKLTKCSKIKSSLSITVNQSIKQTIIYLFEVGGKWVRECCYTCTHAQTDVQLKNIMPPAHSYLGWQWHHRVYGHDTIAILWV